MTTQDTYSQSAGTCDESRCALLAEIDSLKQQLQDVRHQLSILQQKEDARLQAETRPGKVALPLHTRDHVREMQEYVVLDFETTGYSPSSSSVIECGAVLVLGGNVVDTFHTLVKPPKRIPKKVSDLTGLTNEDLTDAPSADTVARRLRAFISDFPIMAHNAQFDADFLESLYEKAGITARIKYADTLELVQHVFPDLHRYSLGALIEEFHLSDCEQTHRALDDALCTQRLFALCADRLLHPPKTAEHRFPTDNFRNLCPQGEVPQDHPLNGKAVVFTGDLSIPREQAAQMAVNVGAVVRSSVSKKTDYVVVGAANLALVGSDGISTKEKTARQLAAAGVPIQIIDEQAFLALVHTGGY